MKAASLNPRTAPTRDLSDIILDPEFGGRFPPPAPEEQARIVERLIQHETPEPLICWRRNGRKILLIGYERFPTLKLYGIAVVVEEREFASREHAKLFIIRHRLARANPTQLEIMYLLGLCYHEEKQEAGGDRRSAQAVHKGKTADALAEIFGELATAVRRAGAVSAAVTKIADLFGCDVIGLLLSRKAKLTAQAVLDLAALDLRRLRDLVGQLRLSGRLPRSWRRAAETADDNSPSPLEAQSTAVITVPVAAPLMAETLRDRLGCSWFAHFSEIVQLLNAQPNPI